MAFDSILNSVFTKNSYYYAKKHNKECFVKQRKDAIDLTGQKFFDLTALYPVKNGKYRGLIWKCKCSCGNECDVFGGHLRANMRKSCGCRSQARIEETGVNRIYSNYKRKAKLRNKEFTISVEQAGILVRGDCVYCGAKPSQILKRLKSRKLQILYNGIDRKDPDIGYTPENCVSSCRHCNQAKSDLTVEQFYTHIERIYKWRLIGS